MKRARAAYTITKRDNQMPISRNVTIVTIASLVAIGFGCSKAPTSAQVDAAKLAMFSALPESVPPKTGGLTEDRVALGRMLYYEARLSKSQTISCNSCHDLAKYGVDGAATSAGFKGQHGDRNSPTVYNAAAHFVQFWDGRAADVEAQAKGPVLNPVEMAGVGQKRRGGVEVHARICRGISEGVSRREGSGDVR